DRAAEPRRPVHHARVEFDDALLVGQTAEPDAVVVRIVLDELDARDRGVDGPPSLAHALHGEFDRLEAVATRDRDRRTERRRACEVRQHQGARGRRLQEATTSKWAHAREPSATARRAGAASTFAHAARA